MRAAGKAGGRFFLYKCLVNVMEHAKYAKPYSQYAYNSCFVFFLIEEIWGQSALCVLHILGTKATQKIL